MVSGGRKLETAAIISGFIGGIGALITAVATIFLWRVTKTLAVETKRLAQASAQPQIVAAFEANQWAINYADIVVANTGNASAFDIQLAFDPALPKGDERTNLNAPLQRVSVLKPGQSVSSYLCEFRHLTDKSFTVTASWRRDPHASQREAISYVVDMREIDNVSYLGSRSPFNQLAEELKKMRDDWHWIASGSRRISVDVFSSGDRLHEQLELRRFRRRKRREQDERAAQSAHIEQPMPVPQREAPEQADEHASPRA
jgi:hypothetical protein